MTFKFKPWQKKNVFGILELGLLFLLFTVLDVQAQFKPDSLKHRISVGLDFSYEVGLKQYPGIKARYPSNLYGISKNNYLSPGGMFGLGVNGGIMVSNRLQIKVGFRWELAPQGTLLAKHDTVAYFSKFNITPSIRYFVPLGSNSSIRWFVGGGLLIGLSSSMQEYSNPTSWNNLTEYSSEIKYKAAIGSMMETGFEVDVKKPRIILNLGLGFHIINYNAKSYSENNKELSLDKLPTDFNLRRIEGSGGGLNFGIRYSF